LIFFIYFHTFSWLWLKPWKTGLNSSNFRIYILINEWTGFHENQSKAGFTGRTLKVASGVVQPHQA
jgi:hypothetical protein